ncbi:MAG: hypothetical protein H6719_15375 [Sandaracinaceae bacterium]|nr:hypothetical protein [Sandaracinaceae bacterium]
MGSDLLLPTVRFFHLLAAAVWTGGMLTLAVLVVALRKAGAQREQLQAAARMFARVSWTAMAIAIGTGLGQVVLMRLPWGYGRLHVKIGLVALAVIIAAVHQLTAKRTSAGVRGAIQGVLLLVSLGIFAAAVALGS